MKVLLISGDRSLLDSASPAALRLALMRGQVDRLDVLGYAGFWSGPRGGFEVLSAVMRARYDVVTVQEPFWRGLLAWIAARVGGATLNVQVHADLSAQPLWRRAFAAFILRRADTVRVVSQKAANDLAPLGLRARISILPIYIDSARFRGLARAAHPRFKRTILWIGRFEEEKDPFAALAVLAEVRRSGADAGLVMLGAGRLERRLRREAARAGLPVEFPGWQDPLPHLAYADVVLSTSRAESYGASLIEALAAGVPVVAPDVGVARAAGAIVAPREELAAAVARVLRDGAPGELTLDLPSAEQWAHQWRETLV